jgi:UDP-2,3-diacylglucosamine hydrolase
VTTLFISDLHLDPAQPGITQQFLEFLARAEGRTEAVYILGDLFEAWLGDDDPEPEYRRVIAALGALRSAGARTYFMHGNRDFLVGERFSTDSGCELLDEHTLIELHGTRLLLMHGDLLCTDDVEYQAFRRMVRDPAWQQRMLALPLGQRAALARQVKSQTRAAVMAKAEEIMDVNQETVEATMRRFDVRTLLHGHTHRPNVHRFALDGENATRIVLGDWYTQGSVVRWDASGFRLESLPRA